MVIQVMDENLNRVSNFLPLFIFRHNFRQDYNQINIYKCFANKQINIFYYITENSYTKIEESTINMFLLFPSVFYHYLKRNWNVFEMNVLAKCMY